MSVKLKAAEGGEMSKNKTVDEYLSRQDIWKSSLLVIREILLSTGLKETIKWSFPVYTSNGKNIVGIGSFKSYVGLWFFQGALLKDEQKKLINAQDGKTKALRQWRFKSKEAIEKEARLIKIYVKEAILNQEQGKEIKPVRMKNDVHSWELDEMLNSSTKIKSGFTSLTTAKQREYAEYINEAKKIETKQRRLEKIKPLLVAGKGLNDKYKSVSNSK
jgi:uncharacterized protein YdeI (YjbR/CyaY-like superfamily)